MTHNVYLYILIMAAVTFAVRVLPMTLIRKQIKSRFLRSCGLYFTNVTRSVINVHAKDNATQSPK